jgi:hypothetical protein
MKAYWRSRVIAPRILTSALDGGEWSALRPGNELLLPIVKEAGWNSEPVWKRW